MQYEYIYCVVHKTYIPYLGTFFFSRYPSVALARNITSKELLFSLAPMPCAIPLGELSWLAGWGGAIIATRTVSQAWGPCPHTCTGALIRSGAPPTESRLVCWQMTLLMPLRPQPELAHKSQGQ